VAFLAAVPAIGLVIRRARDSIGIESEATTLRFSYVLLMTLVLLELSAWPSVALFADAWNGVTEAVVRRAEMEYARVLTRRAIDHPDEVPKERDEFVAGTLGGTRSDDWPRTDGSGSWLFDALTPALCASPTGGARDPKECRELVVLAARSVSSLAFLSVSPYTEPAAQLQQLVHEHAGDGRWVSQRTDGKLRYQMRSTAYAPTISLEATLPSLAIPRSALGYGGALALVLGISWATAMAVRFIVLRLFAIGPRMPERTLLASEGAAPVIWLFARLHGRSINDLWTLEPGAVQSIDLTHHADPATFTIPEPPKSTDVVVVDRLETRLGLEAWDERLLSELERLMATGASFVLVCATDPVFFLGGIQAGSDAKGAPGKAERFTRWMRLLASCASARRTLPECASESEFGRLLAARLPPFEQSSHDAWYWHLWATSTQDEKLAMAQLADEGFLNPNAEDVARQLFDRGLVFRSPELAFFSQSFGEFVLRVRTATDVTAWETAQDDGGWTRIQRPLAILIGIIALFFLLTQPGLYSVVIAMLTAFTTVVPKVVDVLGRFGPKETQAG
jgi:hypothetical protein